MCAETTPDVKVVAGVILRDGRVLIAKRPNHSHQGGLWEFPGGKIESGESAAQALTRELREELGIEVRNCRRLLKVRHAYPDKTVELEFWRVDRFHGEATGLERQEVRWVEVEGLHEFDFPAANQSIVELLNHRK